MKSELKQIKEENILLAAEKIFAKYGYQNTRMEDIANEADITKVTLYNYYKNKENLYMAVTLKALTALSTMCDETIKKHENEPGINAVLGLMGDFLDFCHDHIFYSELFLDYFNLIRNTAFDKKSKKMSKALKESPYFAQVQSIHNYPFKVTALAIEKGKNDGSISKNIDPMLGTLHGWVKVIGYIKIFGSIDQRTQKIFKVDIKSIKDLNFETTRRLLETY